jgi:hypothetical protein
MADQQAPAVSLFPHKALDLATDDAGALLGAAKDPDYRALSQEVVDLGTADVRAEHGLHAAMCPAQDPAGRGPNRGVW